MKNVFERNTGLGYLQRKSRSSGTCYKHYFLCFYKLLDVYQIYPHASLTACFQP